MSWFFTVIALICLDIGVRAYRSSYRLRNDERRVRELRQLLAAIRVAAAIVATGFGHLFRFDMRGSAPGESQSPRSPEDVRFVRVPPAPGGTL